MISSMKAAINFCLKLFACIFTLCVCLLILLETRTGQEWFFLHATKFFKDQTGLQIEYKEASLSFPLQIKMVDNVIYRDSKAIAAIKTISFKLPLHKLFQLSIDAISLQDIFIYDSLISALDIPQIVKEQINNRSFNLESQVKYSKDTHKIEANGIIDAQNLDTPIFPAKFSFEMISPLSSKLKLQTRVCNIEMQLSQDLENHQPILSFEGHVIDISHLKSNAYDKWRGELLFSGIFQTKQIYPVLSLSFDSPECYIFNKPLKALNGTIEVVLDQERPSGHLQVQAMSEMGLLSCLTDWELNPKQSLVLDNFQAAGTSFTSNGKLAYDFASNELETDISALINDIPFAAKGKFNQETGEINGYLESTGVNLNDLQLLGSSNLFKGLASLKATLKGSFEKPLVDLEVELAGLESTVDFLVNKPPLTGKIQLNFSDNQLSLDSDFFGINQNLVKINGVLPALWAPDTFTFSLNDLEQLTLGVNIKGDFASLIDWIYPSSFGWTGFSDIALQIKGAIHAPEIFGNIDLTNVSYRNDYTGMTISNINAHLEAKGAKLELINFSAIDQSGGHILAKGEMSLSLDEHFPFSISLQASDASLISSDWATLTANGKAELIGNTQGALLKGALKTAKGMIRLEETLPKDIKTVDVHYFNIPQEDMSKFNHISTQTKPWLDLDLTLEVINPISIDGHHLTSNWKGFVTIQGTTKTPLLFGDLRLSDGEYDFNGKTFQLTQGNIHFSGVPSKKTTLYVVASKDISNISSSYQGQNLSMESRSSNAIDHVQTEIILKGPVTDPSISFRSHPPLSQREILSYILFNRGIADITTDQGDQLTHSFVSLNSQKQTSASTDFLSRLRNNMGIDRLDFASTNDVNKDYSLQVGKYVTENVFVSINKSINAAANRIAVEVDLGHKFKAQADVGDDSQVRTSLKWKRDY